LFDPYSVFVAGFPTSFGSRDAGVDECADELWSHLREPKDGRPPALSAPRLIFVCHSTGGIVVRHLLVREREKFTEKSVGLALIASPSQGSVYASAFASVASLFGNDLARALQLSNPLLRSIDVGFRRLIDRESIPGLFGREAYENRFPWGLGPLRLPFRIVPRDSAAIYFPDSRLLPGTDHFTTVKPTHLNHTSHRFLQDFLTDLEAKAPPPTSAWTIRHFTWSLCIDDEGDAENCLEFRGIVSHAANSSFALPNAVIGFGHMTDFDIIPARTTPGVTRHSEIVDNVTVKVSIRFPSPPSPESPVDFAIRNFDLNAYPLNLSECRRRPSDPNSGYDYVEKKIDDRIGRFVLHIRFPSRTVFREKPRLSVLIDGKPHQAHSAAMQDSFDYFESSCSAVLALDNPIFPASYRIEWHVGEAASSSAPQPASVASRRLVLQRRLLECRSEFLAPAPVAAALSPFAAAVQTALAEFTGIFVKLLSNALHRSPSFHVQSLDVSLMCPNQDDTALLVLTGFNMGIQKPLEASLAHGNGNAGRAWKLASTRIFLRSKAAGDPKRNTFWVFEQQPRHEILISVVVLDDEVSDLVHAVINIGTWNTWHAREIQAALDADDSIVETLTRQAQSKFLKTLFAELN
jgi:hypothetical protein